MSPAPPGTGIPFVAGGADGQARDGTYAPSRADAGLCWLCGYAIIDPPDIVGQWKASRIRVAHRYCLRVLGELDLDLPPAT